MKLFLWGSRNQATYILEERTLWNRWGSNIRIPIHMLFLVFYFLIIMFYIMYFLLSWSSISMFNRIHNRNFNTTGQTGRIVPVTICYAMFTNTNRHNISYIHPDYSHEPFCSDESNSILRSPNHHYHQRYHHQRHHHHHHHHEIHGIIKS